jgi:hypothetical protein
MIGSKIQIEEKLLDLKSAAKNFYCKRRRYAVEQTTGDFVLRNQRRF